MLIITLKMALKTVNVCSVSILQFLTQSTRDASSEASASFGTVDVFPVM